MTLSTSRHKGILNKYLCKNFRKIGCLFYCVDSNKNIDLLKFHVMRFFVFCLFFFLHLCTTSSQLYYKYPQNLQRLHAKYAHSAKTTKLNLRNTVRKTLDKSAMLALSPRPNTFVCWLGNDDNKENIRC